MLMEFWKFWIKYLSTRFNSGATQDTAITHQRFKLDAIISASFVDFLTRIAIFLF